MICDGVLCATDRVVRSTIHRLVRLLLLSVVAGSCGSSAPRAYVPELGELMLFQQMRHAKLWLAAEADNWPLAEYEVEELQEGFDTIVAYHPTHEGSPVAPKDAIPRMITVPLADLRDAVRRKDRALFAERYDALTSACNGCHKATNFGFNQVQRPTSNPYPNQVFSAQPPDLN